MYGKHHSKEAKKKISDINKGRIAWNKGIPHSEETKKKIRQKAIGRKLSEEHKKKIGESGKGRKNSKETIEKMTKFHFSKEYLEVQYLKLKKSTLRIAKENNCSYETIRKNLNNFKIPKRTHSKAQKIYKNGVKNKRIN